MRYIISKDVDCEWCGAKPGEPCRIQDDSPQGWHYSEHEGHIIRTIVVSDEGGESGA